MEPSTEPYTEQPVGFSLYLVFFLFVLKQPFVAAAVAQALSIVMLYGAVWALTQDFRVDPGFQLACGLAVTLFRPLTFVYTYLWSETLFTALTLWVIHFLLTAEGQPEAQEYLAVSPRAGSSCYCHAVHRDSNPGNIHRRGLAPTDFSAQQEIQPGLDWVILPVHPGPAGSLVLT